MLRHIVRVARVRSAPAIRSSPVSSRSFAVSALAQKKKQSNDAFDDDAFGSFEEDELFASSSDSKSQQQSSSVNSQPSSSASLDERFSVELSSILRYCGKQPATKDDPRKRALLQLVFHARTKTHLEDLTTAVAGWREAKRTVDAETSQMIIGRCITLGHPEVALALLANRPKYGVDLTSLHMAHKLLHALSLRAESAETSSSITSSPIHDVLLLAALYPHYRLPEVFEEPISLAMVLAALKSSSDDEVRAVERDLLEVARASSRRGSGAALKVVLTDAQKAWVDKGRPLVPYPVIWS